MKSKVNVKVPRNMKDKGGFVVNIGEATQTSAGLVLDLFAMPIKPLRLYLEFEDEPERPEETQIEAVEPTP